MFVFEFLSVLSRCYLSDTKVIRENLYQLSKKVLFLRCMAQPAEKKTGSTKTACEYMSWMACVTLIR